MTIETAKIELNSVYDKARSADRISESFIYSWIQAGGPKTTIPPDVPPSYDVLVPRLGIRSSTEGRRVLSLLSPRNVPTIWEIKIAVI